MAQSGFSREVRLMISAPAATKRAASDPPIKSPSGGSSPTHAAAMARARNIACESASVVSAMRRNTAQAPTKPQ